MDPLSNSEIRSLKARAQRLKATLKIGKEGLSPGFLAALDAAPTGTSKYPRSLSEREGVFMRKLALIYATAFPILVASVTGCRYLVSEPYPAYAVSEIPASGLPAAVRNAFIASYPNAAPERVESRSFKGKIDLYRVTFRTSGGELTNVLFTSSGELVTEPGSFPPPEYPREVDGK